MTGSRLGPLTFANPPPGKRNIMNRVALSLLLPSLCLLAAGARADEPDYQPDPASVQRYGPAYRFPQAGWIVLHIEGKPYERGYQHGQLLAPEIAAHLRCMAAMYAARKSGPGWQNTRRLVNALFLRRFAREFLEEMKGIADGAAAAGARFEGRPIDLVDVAAINTWPEIMTLDSALEALPTGLEGLRFPHAQPRAMPKPPPARCSAFAATGPATADGKVVFGHITMFNLYPAYFYNVWLDVKPAQGHRILMCGYPGAMQSGMDYYLNDAGLLIAETTISQTRFDGTGMTEASRIRQAIQYAATIDDAVAILKKENNGLYTNEWLLADVNTNEIALFELGTHKSKLHRSSKNEWIGGTVGFYWGCNNTKDLDVRLETVTSTNGRPANIVFHPSDRDMAWQRLYHKHKGKMGVAFGKEAFTTPPIAAYPSLDAKFTTTDLAKKLKSWSLFGPPLGKTWEPTFDQKQRYPEIRPLVSNPWTLLHGNPPAKTVGKEGIAVDLPRIKTLHEEAVAKEDQEPLLNVPAWHGTLLPKSDGDIWLATAFANYERIVAREKAMRARRSDGELTASDRDDLAVDLFAYRSAYLTAVRAGMDVPLAEVKSDITRPQWYRLASGKGVLVLHELRQFLGEALFEKTMDAFGLEHGGKRVSTAEFQAYLEKAAGKPLDGFFEGQVRKNGLTGSGLDKNGLGLSPASAAFSIISFHQDLEDGLIVYGTADEVPTNREAAEALQEAVRRAWSNITIPVKSDKEVTEAELKCHHVVLIGRPDSNGLVERFRKVLPIAFGSRSFAVRGKTYANPLSAVVAAAGNPLAPRYSLVVVAGLGAEATRNAALHFVRRGQRPAEVLVLPQGEEPLALVISRPGQGPAVRPR
jgi:hypothetical protein